MGTTASDSGPRRGPRRQRNHGVRQCRPLHPGGASGHLPGPHKEKAEEGCKAAIKQVRSRLLGARADVGSYDDLDAFLLTADSSSRPSPKTWISRSRSSTDRSSPSAGQHRGNRQFGPVHQRVGGRSLGELPAQLLRPSFLQSAERDRRNRADRQRPHRSRRPRLPRERSAEPPGTGNGSHQRHASLCRKPRRIQGPQRVRADGRGTGPLLVDRIVGPIHRASPDPAGHDRPRWLGRASGHRRQRLRHFPTTRSTRPEAPRATWRASSTSGVLGDKTGGGFFAKGDDGDCAGARHR